MADDPTFPHKIMGTLSRRSLESVGTLEIHAVADRYVRNPAFDPYVSKNGKDVLNEQDPMLVELRSKYADHVVEDVLRAVRELREHNPSGRYPVVVPWDVQRGILSWGEVMMLLVDERRNEHH